MSVKQVFDEALTMVVAGHETTSLCLAYSLYWIARNPPVEQTLRSELQEVLAGREPTQADLPRLKYLRMVINETLRLTPSAC